MPAQYPHRSLSSTYEGYRAVLNVHLSVVISSISATTSDMGNNDDEQSTTQLDSNANMEVVGSLVAVFGHPGRSAAVLLFFIDFTIFPLFSSKTNRREHICRITCFLAVLVGGTRMF